MKPTARRRLGKYVLLGRLGHGGMGKIYLAHAPGPAGIEKLLVVKRLHSHLTGDPVLVSSFLDEARLSMALNHPNIGHTYDVGEVDGRYFMVMEFIDGQNLGVVLRMAKRSGQYPKSSLWGGIFLSVLDGLHAAHTARDARGRPLQIIHRDVSPQNILLTYEGLPKLVDFGIAKAAMRVQETDAGTLKGKYAYMSPEQVRGEPLDARSDIFAAGIVLWEMLAGRRLYKAETIVRSVERILQEPLISPVRVNADCHPELAKVALKALHKDKTQRFATADEFKDALEDAIAAAGERFKPQQGKELMQRLFKDVIEKQRAVLEQCLNQTGDIPDDVDEDDRRAASDSQSDLRMPRLPMGQTELGADSSTTPSARRSSPLVTAEGDDPSGAPLHGRSGAREPGALLAPPRERETLMERRSSSLPPVKEGASGPVARHDAGDLRESLLAPPLPEPSEPTDPLETTAPRRRSLVVPLGAALFGVLAAVVVVVVFDAFGGQPKRVPVGDAGSPGAIAATTPKPTTEATTNPTLDTPVADGIDAGPAQVALLPAEPVEPVEPADSVEPVEPVEPAEPAERVGLVETDAPKEPVVAGERRPRRRPVRPNKTIEKPVEKAPDARPDEEATVVEGQGFLTLDTVPWTTVYLGKKKLGETPLVRVPVPAGTLELTLQNPEANIKEAYFAKVKPGETFAKRLDLR